MSDLGFWKIGQGDEDLARRVKESFDKLYARPPKNYQFELTGEDNDFIPDETRTYFVVGRDLDNLLGYASCHRSPPTDNIGSTSKLIGLDHKPKLSDFDGNEVTREALGEHDGYSEYTGRGDALYIGIIEAFQQRRGTGSRLLDFIKSQGYEIIELEANGFNQVQFFEANGFVDTGIDAEEREQRVLVWNNPEYTTPKGD